MARSGPARRGGGSSGVAAGEDGGAAAWLAGPAAADLVRRHDLARLLREGGGLARIPGFLPDGVARRARAALLEAPARRWERTSTAEREDSGYADSIPHDFRLLEVEGDGVLLGVARLLWRLVPHSLPNFTAAMYGPADHIAPHDDSVREQYTWQEVVELAKNYSTSSQKCDQFGLSPWAGSRAFRRDTAAVYYLTDDWPEDIGGLFVDLESGEKIKPEFNTLLVFSVPRMHMVTAVEAIHARRLSLFGWWLTPAPGPAAGGCGAVAPRAGKRPAAATARDGGAAAPRARKRPAAAAAQPAPSRRQVARRRPAAAGPRRGGGQP